MPLSSSAWPCCYGLLTRSMNARHYIKKVSAAVQNRECDQSFALRILSPLMAHSSTRTGGYSGHHDLLAIGRI